MSRPMPPLGKGLLTLQAGRLVSTAQAVQNGQPVPEILYRLCRLRGLPTKVNTAEGHQAVARAAFRLSRLGLVDTCLVRSLALAALLADQEKVRLHLGFRPSDSPDAMLAGHAWVSVADRPVPDDRATLVDGQPCEEVVVLTATRVTSHRVIQEQP